VRTYRDLAGICREIEKEEQKRWNKDEDMKPGSAREKAFRDRWTRAALKDSAAIRSFDSEGERMLCSMCARTIFMALEDGELPCAPNPEDYSMLSLEAATAEHLRSMDSFPEGIRYLDRFGRTYRAGMLEEESECRVFLHKARDKRGTVHTFACYMQSLTDHYRIFEAFEIHRLTKAGKIGRDYTGTDYHFRTDLKERCPADSDEDKRRIYTGFLELAGRIREALTNPSLEWAEDTNAASSSIPMADRQCSLRSSGELKIEYVDEDELLVQGRQWNGGRYSFMIDGVLFTGEEVAQMSGSYEGWTLQYRFADPADRPLRAGEYLMPVRIDDRLLVEEMSELLNLFSSGGKFISDHDKKNFGILFEKTVLKKLKLYHESNPRGYGRLAAMHLIQRLRWVEDTGLQEELIRQIVRR
jgi:hypothetical protein